MTFPLMPMPVRVSPFVGLRGTITSLDTTRPDGTEVGDLAVGVTGQAGNNAANVQLDLGGGAATQIGSAVSSGITCVSKSWRRVLDSTDVAGSGFTMAGTDPSGGVAVYALGNYEVASASELDTDATTNGTTATVSAAVSTSGPSILLVSGFSTSGDVGALDLTSADVTWDVEITGERGDQDSAFILGAKLYRQPVSDTITVNMTITGGDPAQLHTLQMVIIELS